MVKVVYLFILSYLPIIIIILIYENIYINKGLDNVASER